MIYYSRCIFEILLQKLVDNLKNNKFILFKALIIFENLNLLNLACLITLLVITACGDEPQAEVTDPLIGVWKWTYFERLNCPDPADDGIFSSYDCTAYCYEVEFRTGRKLQVTVIEAGKTVTGEGTWLRSGDKLTYCINDGGNEYCTFGEIINSTNEAFELLIPKKTADVCDVIRYFEKK